MNHVKMLDKTVQVNFILYKQAVIHIVTIFFLIILTYNIAPVFPLNICTNEIIYRFETMLQDIYLVYCFDWQSQLTERLRDDSTLLYLISHLLFAMKH